VASGGEIALSKVVPCSSRGDSGSRLSSVSEDFANREIHPKFPRLHALVPLTYALTMQACLADDPDARPTFGEVLTLLEGVAVDVAAGSYVDSRGHQQVRHPRDC
jgi:hypothetical protein